MSTTTISIGGNNVTLVALPTFPGARSIEFHAKEAVGTVVSPFTGQVQTQQWPGAEMWSGTLTMPPLEQALADNWIAFLMELRGMTNAFQLGDPLKQTPRGTPSGTPVVNNSLNNGNLAMSQALGTSGWTASATNLLLPGDYIQVGYRLYRVLDAVNADGSGNAMISIWPSLREVPTNSANVITSNTQGLFRLASNDRAYSFDITKLTHISFPFQEFR